MESGHVFIITVIAIVTSGVTVGMVAQAWAESRKRTPAAAPSPRLDAIEARLGRIEETIETVALEMERVAEGQRFTAKVLAERTGASAQPLASRPAAPEGRITTPH